MKKQSLFSKFFIALVLFIAVPMIIITSILSYQVVKYSETELSNSATGKLIVAENLSELIADKVYKDALDLTLDTVLKNMEGITRFSDIFKDTDSTMKVYAMQQALTNLVGTNDTLYSAYLLMDDSDYIMATNQGIFKMSDFSDTAWLDQYKNFKEFKSGSTWLPARIVNSTPGNSSVQSTSNKVITVFYTFTPYTTSVKGTLILNIKERAIFNLVNGNSAANQGYIEIVNNDGDIISHIQENLIGTKLKENYFKEILESKKTEGYLINNTTNGRKLITYYKSAFNNWIYIGFFPIDKLMSKVNTLMMRTIYVCLACLFLGILVSYFISKRISSPLNKLVQDIRIKKGIDIKSNDSEMAILSGAFDYMIKEEDRLFSILENSKDNNRNIQLMNLFQGKTNEEWSKELTGIDFNCSDFICTIVLIDKYKEFSVAYTPEQRDYIKLLILKVLEKLVGNEYKCAGMVYEKQKIALVINFNKSSEELLRLNLENAFTKVQEEMSKIIDSTISIGIGSIVETMSGVSESFDKAQEALRFKLISGYGSINFWKDINNEETAYYYPYAIEKHIFNMMNSGTVDKLDEAVGAMIREISDIENIHYENVLQVFNQLAVNTVKFLLDQHLNISMIFGSNYNIYHILSTKETLDDIRIWLVGMYSTITDHLAKSRNQSKSYFGRTLDYIHKNYKKNIDINAIAESIGLSYSHLRKIFKDETGENIVNYVNNMRISESKRLLCMTNMTVREIALNLGYNNEQSFIRFFKKFENISPGEFRVTNKISPAGYLQPENDKAN